MSGDEQTASKGLEKKARTRTGNQSKEDDPIKKEVDDIARTMSKEVQGLSERNAVTPSEALYGQLGYGISDVDELTSTDISNPLPPSANVARHLATIGDDVNYDFTERFTLVEPTMRERTMIFLRYLVSNENHKDLNLANLIRESRKKFQPKYTADKVTERLTSRETKLSQDGTGYLQDVIRVLTKEGCLTQVQSEELKQLNTWERLIDMIKFRGLVHYWKLLKAIRSSGHNDIACMIESPGILELKVKKKHRIPKPALWNVVSRTLAFFKQKQQNLIQHTSVTKLFEQLSVNTLDVYEGSIILVLQCPSVESLDTIWELYNDKTLGVLMNKELLSKESLQTRDEYLALEIEEDQYQRCRAELSRLEAIAYHGWQDRLHQQGDLLTDNMCNPMVIEQLWSCGALDSSERHQIRAEGAEDQQNCHLLKMLKNKDGWTFVQFIKALDMSGQEHLSYILQQNGDADESERETDGLMTTVQLETLRSNHMALLDNIELDTVLLAYLRAHKVITRFDYERIKSVAAPIDQTILFLHTLRQKPMRCYDAFVECLRDARQLHLASLLTMPKEMAQGDAVTLNSVTQNNINMYQWGVSEVSIMILFTVCLYMPFMVSKYNKS